MAGAYYPCSYPPFAYPTQFTYRFPSYVYAPPVSQLLAALKTGCFWPDTCPRHIPGLIIYVKSNKKLGYFGPDTCPKLRSVLIIYVESNNMVYYRDINIFYSHIDRRIAWDIKATIGSCFLSAWSKTINRDTRLAYTSVADYRFLKKTLQQLIQSPVPPQAQVQPPAYQQFSRPPYMRED
jgi:hypothetical protein